LVYASGKIDTSIKNEIDVISRLLHRIEWILHRTLRHGREPSARFRLNARKINRDRNGDILPGHRAVPMSGDRRNRAGSMLSIGSKRYGKQKSHNRKDVERMQIAEPSY
jgi:hypothetical protein